MCMFDFHIPYLHNLQSAYVINSLCIYVTQNGGQLAPSYYLYWEQLSAAEKKAARFLGYTKQSWNQCETFEGRNLRGYDAAVSNDAVSLNLEGGGIICPDGRTAITNTFCGRGPARRDCDEGQFCYVHPTDAFAVCCSDPTSTSGAEVAD